MINRRNFREVFGPAPVRHPVGKPGLLPPQKVAHLDLGLVLQITIGPGSHFVNYFGC